MKAKPPDELWGYSITDMGGLDAIESDHGELMKQIRLIFPEATDMQVALMVGLVCGTCGGCHNAKVGCYCMVDD